MNHISAAAAYWEAAIVQCQNVFLIGINVGILRRLFTAAVAPGLGTKAMATVAEYRKWAEECFGWAREAHDESVSEQYASLGAGLA
jgi:hypothetical protein